jgi:predicted ATP-grasp superfamily ATP-dependent carboligase
VGHTDILLPAQPQTNTINHRFAWDFGRNHHVTPLRAESAWPPVVVASVFQTGLNLMRDLLRRGVRTVGVDCDASHEGFRSAYGKSYLCPNPDTDPDGWLAFMVDLAKRLGGKPVIIPAADIFVTAMGRHVDALKQHYIFSPETIAVQAALATKEQQYALAAQHGLPIPRTAYIQSRSDLERFAAEARFPCLIKPRHQREWDALPIGNRLRGLKLITADTAEQLIDEYAFTEPHRPEVVAQEIIAGGDDAKYCYLSVYGSNSRRLGHTVVHELRAHPVLFGSGSIVEPVIDPEIATLCDNFLRGIGYVGICEIEVKRDIRDGVVRLIEANPRYSVTADASVYAGVDIGWLHYLDLIGQSVEPVEATRFGVRHIVLRRDIPAIPRYVDGRILTWKQIRDSYRGPLAFFDFDLRDWRPTATTLKGCIRVAGGTILRSLGLRKRLG